MNPAAMPGLASVAARRRTSVAGVPLSKGLFREGVNGFEFSVVKSSWMCADSQLLSLWACPWS